MSKVNRLNNLILSLFLLLIINTVLKLFFSFTILKMINVVIAPLSLILIGNWAKFIDKNKRNKLLKISFIGFIIFQFCKYFYENYFIGIAHNSWIFSGNSWYSYILLAFSLYIIISEKIGNNKKALYSITIFAIFTTIENSINIDIFSKLITFFPFFYFGWIFDDYNYKNICNKWYKILFCFIVELVGAYVYFKFKEVYSVAENLVDQNAILFLINKFVLYIFPIILYVIAWKICDFIKFFDKTNFLDRITKCVIKINNKEIFIKIRESNFFNIIILSAFSYLLSLIILELSVGNLGNQMYISYLSNLWILLLNYLPVLFVSLVVYFITKNSTVSFAITSIFFLLLAFVNISKMQLRNDILLFEDIFLIKEAINMKGRYSIDFTKEMLQCILNNLILSFLLFYLLNYKRSKYIRKKYKYIIRAVLVILLIVTGSIGFNKFYLSTEYYQKTSNIGNFFNIWSPINDYIQRGTVYSFLNSYKSSMVQAPNNYNENEEKNKLLSYKYDDIPDEKKVNVFGIMLEAYNDFSKYNQIEFDIDPYEELHLIQDSSVSGQLVTNIFAGGTVNTERKFLTGYNSSPSLRKKTNSYVWYFKEQGYTTEGSHPCYEWFYNRINVNKNLGFDNYYFFEDTYSNLSDGHISNDNILMENIYNLWVKHKENSTTPLFSFNVTYQNHGPYSTDYTDEVYVKYKEEYTLDEYNIMNNYFKGIKNTGEELLKLKNKFENDDSPIVLILFGDHNPWMGNDNSVYTRLNINLNLNTEEGALNYYSTPYIIWANNAAKKILENDFIGKGERISPNYLMNEFFELAGYKGNEFMKISNEMKETLNVLNTDFYFKNNEFQTTLDDKCKDILDNYQNLEFYWKYNFRKK